MSQDQYTPPEGFSEDTLFQKDADLPRDIKRMRKYAHQRKGKTWEEKKRRHRAREAVALRWKIKTDPNGAGVFTTHDILPGSAEWPGNPPGSWDPHAWADFYFMSRRPVREGIFYNAVAQSALAAAVEKIEEMAEQAVKDKMSPQDREASRIRTFTRPLDNGMTEMVFAPDIGLDSLGGLTKYGAQAQWLRQHWDDLPEMVKICPKAEIDREYQFGLGLHLTTEEISVDTLSLPRIIEQFLDRGEVEYEDDPVDLTAIWGLLAAHLKATLWRWDSRQAQAEGRDPPELDEELTGFLNTKSNAIRL